MAIIISSEVVLDIRVPLTEEAGARAAVEDLTARPGAGVEGEGVGVDVSTSLAYLRILRRRSLRPETSLCVLFLLAS